MEVPHGEGVASRTGPESCAYGREVVGEALTGERAGWVIEPRKICPSGRRRCSLGGRHHGLIRDREDHDRPRVVEDPSTSGSVLLGNRETSGTAGRSSTAPVRVGKARSRSRR